MYFYALLLFQVIVTFLLEKVSFYITYSLIQDIFKHLPFEWVTFIYFSHQNKPNFHPVIQPLSLVHMFFSVRKVSQLSIKQVQIERCITSEFLRLFQGLLDRYM